MANRVDADHWNRRYEERADTWPVDPCAAVVAVAERRRAGRALDVACGTGRNAIYLARGGWSVTAVDYAHVGIDFGKRRAAEAGVSIDWRVVDITAEAPPRATFDLVTLCYLHMPWEAYARVAIAAWEAVAPGGELVVVGHDRSNIREGTGGPQDPGLLYTPDEVVDLLVASGPNVEVLRAERDIGPVDHGPEQGTGAVHINCVVVARRGSSSRPHGAGKEPETAARDAKT